MPEQTHGNHVTVDQEKIRSAIAEADEALAALNRRPVAVEQWLSENEGQRGAALVDVDDALSLLAEGTTPVISRVSSERPRASTRPSATPATSVTAAASTEAADETDFDDEDEPTTSVEASNPYEDVIVEASDGASFSDADETALAAEHSETTATDAGAPEVAAPDDADDFAMPAAEPLSESALDASSLFGDADLTPPPGAAAAKATAAGADFADFLTSDSSAPSGFEAADLSAELDLAGALEGEAPPPATVKGKARPSTVPPPLPPGASSSAPPRDTNAPPPPSVQEDLDALLDAELGDDIELLLDELEDHESEDSSALEDNGDQTRVDNGKKGFFKKLFGDQ